MRGGNGFIMMFSGAAGQSGIVLSNATFLANAAQGTAIGTLSVIGGVGTYTFTLTNSAGGKVQVAGGNGQNLQVGAVASSAGSFSISVHADNGAGSTFDKTFTIAALSASQTLQSDVGVDILADVGSPILVQ